MHTQRKVVAMGLIYNILSCNLILLADLDNSESNKPSSSLSSASHPHKALESTHSTLEQSQALRLKTAEADLAEARLAEQQTKNERAHETFFEHLSRPETLVNIINIALVPIVIQCIQKCLLEGPTQQEARETGIKVELAELTLKQKKAELEDQQLTLRKRSSMIAIRNEQAFPVDVDKLKRNAQNILDTLNYADFDLDILLSTPETMQKHNKSYRGRDSITDTLSLPPHQLRPGDRIEPTSDETKHLGNIIICPQYVYDNLGHWNQTFQQRMDIVLMHGICHLLGYDHIEDVDYEVMQQKETELFEKITES